MEETRSINLSEEYRLDVRIVEYNGKARVDVRLFNKNGHFYTKKGIIMNNPFVVEWLATQLVEIKKKISGEGQSKHKGVKK